MIEKKEEVKVVMCYTFIGVIGLFFSSTVQVEIFYILDTRNFEEIRFYMQHIISCVIHS